MAESFGVRATVEWKPGYSVLVNTPQETAFAREAALEPLGPGRVTLQGSAITASEDFAFMLERVPGSYLFIGNGNAGEAAPCHACSVHNPVHDLKEANITVGAAYWALLARRILRGHRTD